MKFRPVFHPILMAVFPILFLYATNIGEVEARDAALPLIVFVTATLGIWGILALAFRNGKSAALATTLILTLFSSFGHMSKTLDGFSIGNFVVGRNKYLIPLWAILFCAGLAVIIRMQYRKRLDEWTHRANVFALILVIVSLVQLLTFQLHREIPNAGGSKPVNPYSAFANPAETKRPQEGMPKNSRPDIYYIIPDSYEASSSLKEVFGFDNNTFTKYLESKGFFVATESRSNYTFTALSLSSSMNMHHLDYLTEKMGASSSDMAQVEQLMRDNAVMRFLKSEGYTLINAGSWWGPTYNNRNADINLKSSRFDEFSLKLIEGTLLAPFMEEFTEDDLRNKLLFTFKNLEEIPSMEAPTFTLAHILCPHPPYIFGPDGENVPTFQRVLGKSDPRGLYIDQVKFINTKLREAVDHILANSKTPPIIIIQGDHGAAYTHRVHPRAGLLPDDSYLREQMRIFNAYYLPGLGKNAIPDSITPVNTFRIVFNVYFNQHLPMLENQSFYSTRDLPFSFTNVTQKVTYR